MTDIKKKILKLSFFSILGVGIFFGGGIAKASDIIDISNATSSYLNYRTKTDVIQQTFYPKARNLSKITMYTGTIGGATSTLEISLCRGIPVSYDFSCSGATYLTAGTMTPDGTRRLWTFTPATPIDIDPTFPYYFLVRYTGATTWGIYQGIMGSSGIPVNYNYLNDLENYWSTNTSIGWFSTFYSSTYSNDLRFNTPVNLETYSDTGLSDWDIKFYIPDYVSTFSTYMVNIYYGTSTSNLLWTDQGLPYGYTEGWNSRLIHKNTPLGTGTYFVKGYLYKNGSLLGSTTPIQFFIDNTSTTTDWSATLPKMTNSEICAGLDTGTIMSTDSIACAFRRAIHWATYPSASTIVDLQVKYDLLKQKFPFNAYYGITDTITSAFSTSTNMTGTLGVPFIRNTGTSTSYYILPVLSSSSLPNAIGQTNTTNIRLGLGFLFWILCFGLIYIQVRPK